MQPQIPWNVLLLSAATALWLVSLPHIDYRHMGDWGLLDKLPATYLLSLAFLTAGFTVSLRRAGAASWWPGLHSVALLFALKAPTAILYDQVRYPWASKHEAVVAHLLANAELRPGAPLSGNMAAYDQWPGFFALNATLVRAFGVTSAQSYLNWAAIFYGLVLIPVLVFLYRTFSKDQRLVWTGVWIFEAANWVGQDYFSPQGMAFIIHLSVLAVVLRHFVRPGSAGGLRSRDSLDPAAACVPPSTTFRRRAVGVALLIPLIAAINCTHQLTPVMLCVSLLALQLTRRYRNAGPLAVAVLIMLVWDLTMGRPLFIETLASLKESAGSLLDNSRAGYAGQLTGPGPVLQGRADTLMVLVIAALAAFAVAARRRLLKSALPLLLVSIAPVPLLAVNDYGGEMLFRVYLFGLPGAAFFAAAALVPASGGAVQVASQARPLTGERRAREPGRLGISPVTRHRISAVALPVVLLALGAGFLPAYYGKERMHYTPPAETALVTRAIDRAPPGSLILGAINAFPMALRRYDQLQHWYFVEQELPENTRILDDPVSYLAPQLPQDGRPAFVLLTRTQEIYIDSEALLPPGGFQELTAKLEASPLFRVTDRNAYGTVLEYRPASR
ncbi:hypothetical protein ACIBL5_31955 [Streptomyces sp. NPDC050516]|uniref:hypothetical protein n=1 Tax=Streptomyces sp. NPDC050516 TaxID=3365621 RepID=UPI00378802B1